MHSRSVEGAEDEGFEPLNFFLRFNRPQQAKRKHINKACSRSFLRVCRTTKRGFECANFIRGK